MSNKVNMSALRLSAAEFISEFRAFGHALSIYERKVRDLDDFHGGKVSFHFAEMEDPEEQLQKEIEIARNIAMKKLFKLNHEFSTLNKGEYIIGKLEPDEFEEVLEEILAL